MRDFPSPASRSAASALSASQLRAPAALANAGRGCGRTLDACARWPGDRQLIPAHTVRAAGPRVHGPPSALQPGRDDGRHRRNCAFLVLVFTPGPLWHSMQALPQRRRLKPVMAAARIACPLSFILLSIASLTQTAEGLAERILATSLALWIGTLAIVLIGLSGRSNHPTSQTSPGAALTSRSAERRPSCNKPGLQYQASHHRC
jgi:hypothetical protein